MNYFNKVSITVFTKHEWCNDEKGKSLMNASGTHSEIRKLSNSIKLNPVGMKITDPDYILTMMQNGGSFYKHRSRVNFWFNGVAG